MGPSRSMSLEEYLRKGQCECDVDDTEDLCDWCYCKENLEWESE